MLPNISVINNDYCSFSIYKYINEIKGKYPNKTGLTSCTMSLNLDCITLCKLSLNFCALEISFLLIFSRPKIENKMKIFMMIENVSLFFSARHSNLPDVALTHG